MRVSIFIAMCLLLTACSTNSEKERYARLVEQWQGREIVLPEVMTDVMTGDTIDLSDADFTILTYVDSAGCTRCKLRLSVWNEFANSLDSISDATVKLLMIVNPKVDNELAYFLKRESYLYPVCIDIDNQVNITNRFPMDRMAQSFLLDRNNKVLAIGNPTLSNGIASFYRSIISGNKSLSIDNDAIVTVVPQDISIGTLSVGDSKLEHFRLINDSNDTIFIRRIESSCYCTEAFIPTEILPPKSNVEGTVKFIGDTITGEFHNTIHIFFEGFDYPSILYIKGSIK